MVFLALHGTYGEDGTVQAQLDELGVPYTGCDPEASRVAFDKVLTKQRCVEAGVPTARFMVFQLGQRPVAAGLESAGGPEAGAAGLERGLAIRRSRRGLGRGARAKRCVTTPKC